MVEFNRNDDELALEATADAVLLLGHALPSNEPMVSCDPFVMKSEAEIQQAYRDYQRGTFGARDG